MFLVSHNGIMHTHRPLLYHRFICCGASHRRVRDAIHYYNIAS